MPAAVEELLRYDSPVQLTMRFAMEDAPLGPHAAERGTFVILILGAANRDAAQFDDPTRLDLGRANAHSHLSFGAGIHYCLGGPLARLEGEIAIAALLRRLPGLALAAGDRVARAHRAARPLGAARDVLTTRGEYRVEPRPRTRGPKESVLDDRNGPTRRVCARGAACSEIR